MNKHLIPRTLHQRRIQIYLRLRQRKHLVFARLKSRQQLRGKASSYEIKRMGAILNVSDNFWGF